MTLAAPEPCPGRRALRVFVPTAFLDAETVYQAGEPGML